MPGKRPKPRKPVGDEILVRSSNSDSLFLPGAVFGQKLDWLVDTGCNVTLLSTGAYYRIPEHQRPRLTPYSRVLTQAGGTPLYALGTVEMTVVVGKQRLKQAVVVADCIDSGILGLDFLSEHGGQIDLKTGFVRIGGVEIPFHKQKLAHIARVSAADTVTVKAGTRMILEAKAPQVVPKGTWLVEPLPRAVASDTLAVAKVLSSGGSDSLLLEVMNPSSFDATLYQGTHLATVEAVEVLPELRPISQTGTDTPVKINKVSDQSSQAPLPPELEQLYNEIEYPLNCNEKRAVKNMLVRNKLAFKPKGGPLGKTDMVKHDIKTTTEQPIKQRARRFPIHQRDEGQRLVDEMLDEGVIEPSTSPWASPVVLVKKKSGETRFCVDYRKLNDISIKDAYPLPRIDDCLDALAGAKCFSTLDLASGYWQVGLTDQAKEKSAFVTNSGLYQWKVMPFGLCNAPSTFERLMEKVLAGLTWQICLVYLDDVIVFSRTVEEHISRLETILQKLIQAGLKLKPKKCFLFRKEVAFLGHVVSSEGVSTDPEKIRAIQEWKTPQDLTDVRSFLGLCSYYRKFVPHFSAIAKPLTKLTEKGQPFAWGEEQEKAWLQLKEKLLTAPVLAYPIPGVSFTVDCDASGYGIGAVLSQVQDGRERVISYGSRSLTKEERRYCVTKREMLAMVYFLKQYRHYLYGQKFHVRTDHGALRWLMGFKDPQGQVARWLEVLGTYNFTIEHRPGPRHGNADAMSRGPCRQCGMDDTVVDSCKVLTRSAAKKQTAEPLEEKPPTPVPWTGEGALTAGRIAQAQREDAVLSKLFAWQENASRPSWFEISSEGLDLKVYWAQWDSLLVKDGLLCRRLCLDGKPDRMQILLPISLQDEALRNCHNVVTAGHLGVRRTLAAVRARFFWPHMKRAVQRW